LREWDERDWVPFNLNEDDITIQHRTGGTHPRTEQRPMCGRLVLSMVPGMFSGLDLSQPADGEHAYDENY